MNTPTTSPEQSTSPATERPLGYWLRAVDHSIKRSMHDALTEDGLGRRAWRILSTIESGATSVEELEAALPQRRRAPRGLKGFGRRGGFGPGFGRGFGPGFDRPDGTDRPDQSTDTPVDGAAAEHSHDHEHGRPGHDRGFGRGRDFGPGFGRGHRFGAAPFGPGHREHHGPRGRRRSTEEIVMDFAARGWVIIDGDGITLTEAGREAHHALRTKVDAVRQTVTDAVSPEDLATTLTSLEGIARAFGWDEHSAHEHGPRGRFGGGPRGNR